MKSSNPFLHNCTAISSQSFNCQLFPQNQNYLTTGCLLPISSSWRQAPFRLRLLFFFNLILAIIVLMQHPLSREDGPVVYNCCWPSPAQSFSGPSLAGFMTTFNCLRFETPLNWRTRFPYLYPPGTRWPSYTPRHWVSLSSPPTTRRPTVEVFDPASARASRVVIAQSV
jgi:hypothetical protein